MSLHLYNTLTKSVQEFQPLDPENVRLFVCGPTVYDYSHLGHAKTYIQLDILARVLRANNFAVTYLQNITDIDDKIIKRSAERGTDWQQLRDEFQQYYLEDMQQLNNTSVDTYARATDYMDDILRQVQTLIDTGHAYTIEDDGIYFEIATFAEYGKLSGRTELKENDAQTRIDQSDNKRGWNDFCLWKFSKDSEPTWKAPFGDGRPGWHIEDTAITEHFFGPQYDIHGGAIDLIFPHHEAEITQMESASGKQPFVRYWIHTGFLNINSEKMSKSLGNFHTIRDVMNDHDPMAIRLLMLQSHYRSSVNFDWDNLEAANNRLKRWRAIAELRWQTHDTLKDDDDKSSDILAAPQAILEKLNDDLATPEALKVIDESFNRIETTPLENIRQQSLVQLLEFIDETLGLKLLDSTPDISDEQKQLLIERRRARDNKDWATSDQLRDELHKSGIAVRDTAHYTIWQRD